MAGKRQTSEQDSLVYGKMSRVAAEPQKCPMKKTSHEDMLSYKSFLTYSMPGFDQHSTSNPWSSTTAYLQYTGNALNQHLRTEEASVRCQRQEAERLHNHSQFHEMSGNHLQVQQHHQVLRYPLPSSHVYPPLAVPRPIYMNPTNFVDTNYGTRGLSVQGRPPHIHAQTVEWNSAHFAYPSPPIYPTGVNKKLHSAHTAEHGKLPLGVPEMTGSCRQKEDVSMALAVPSSHQEPFIDRYTPFAQPNPLILYAQGETAIGRQKSSAFNPITHKHQNYMSGALQDNIDSRLGPVHPRSHYSSDGVSYPHQSTFYNYNENTNFLPYLGMSTIVNPNEEHGVKLAQVNRDLSMGMSDTSRHLKMNEKYAHREERMATIQKDVVQNVCSTQVNREMQLALNSAKRDMRVSSVPMDQELQVRMTQLNRNIWVTPSKEIRESHKERHVGAAHGNSSMQKVGQSSHLLTSVSSGDMHSTKTVQENLLASQQNSTFNSHTSYINKDASVCVNSDGIFVQQSKVNSENVRHCLSTPERSSQESHLLGTRGEKLRSNEKEPALPSPKVHCHSDSLEPESDNNGPCSPPMPVINDVFSLAPYRDYLEGTAPHPFPLLRGHGGKNEESVLRLSTPERKKENEKVSTEPSTPDRVQKHHGHQSPTKSKNIKETDAEPDSLNPTEVEEVVLDLSLKKTLHPCSPHNKGAYHSHNACSSTLELSKTSTSQVVTEYPLSTTKHSTACSSAKVSMGACTEVNAQAGIHGFPQTTISCLKSTFMQSSTGSSSQTSVLCFPQNSSSCFSPSVFVSTVQSPTKCASHASLLPPYTNATCSQQNVPPSVSNNLSHCSTPFLVCSKETRRERTRYPSDSSLVSPASEPDNEGNGFHSSKSFLFKKYKLRKLGPHGGETQLTECNSATRTLPSPFPLLSESVHSLPPSAPESSPTLGEANVSLASGGETAVGGSGRQFNELHHSVRAAISNSVTCSPPALLQDWLIKSKETERPKSPVKSKAISRTSEPSQDHELWLTFDGVRMLLHKLLSHLETFMFTRRCPFPHVIRAGAIFIPIYLVKEVLFTELVSASVDRVLQRHKVELRPTTLSEEKLLREKKLKDCPSRLLKLLALKQLPDVYPDLLHLYWGFCVQNQLGNCAQISLKEKGESQPKETLESSSEGFPKKEASAQKRDSSLILKLHRISQPCGNHVYRAQKLKLSQDKGADGKPKKQMCLKKKVARKYKKCPYRKRRRGLRKRTGKGNPNLVGRRILHLFDDGKRETWFRGKVVQVHRPSENPKDTQYEVWYDDEPGTRYFLELLQDYEKGWLRFEKSAAKKAKA
ncbi:uncharacterized protein C15orf39 homolog isoform X1 [Pelobates fuscus]|uniref:uncharacterized protein C15orf39 homolog isoform X1 n=1 Tax=Pelobates fuscus TaxID=191477 RepID=UPI002FE47AEF